ncbi:MAG: hypothetical protein RLZZ58_217 [Pseudomonadota bacterium]
MRAAALPLLLPLLLVAACTPAGAQREHGGVVSIDYCADQTMLALVDRSDIRAVSPEAASDARHAGPLARGLPVVRPDLESILALNPATVVRSYGGGPALAGQLRRHGITVVDLGYAATLADARRELLSAGDALGSAAVAARLAARMDGQLAAARDGHPRGSLLYITPGDVTTGPDSFVADIMRSAGYASYRTQPGWGSLPLEALTRTAPSHVLRAFYDSPAYRQDHWSTAAHPALARALKGVPETQVPGAWVACGNWLGGNAVAALARDSAA